MSALEFWNQLVTGGWNCLDKWCTNRQPETLHLEFKPASMKDGDVAAANLVNSQWRRRGLETSMAG